MKKKKAILLLVAVIVIISAIAVGMSLPVLSESEENNDFIQTWLEENIGDADAYQFIVCMSITHDYDSSEEQWEDLPANINEYYQISVSKSKKIAKIELYETYIWNGGFSVVSDDGRSYVLPITSHMELYYDEVYYISISDGEVFLYLPGDDGYTVEEYANASFAEALDAVLFSDDVAFLDGEADATGYGHTDGVLTSMSVQRAVDITPFWEVFAALNGDVLPEGSRPVWFSFFYSYEIESMRSCSIQDFQALYNYAYEAITGETYTNEFAENGMDYERTIEIDFPNLDDLVPDDFDLPAVD